MVSTCRCFADVPIVAWQSTVLMLCAFVGCSITATRACQQLRIVGLAHVRALAKVENRLQGRRTFGGSGSEDEASDGLFRTLNRTTRDQAFTTSMAWSQIPLRSTIKVETLDQITSRNGLNNDGNDGTETFRTDGSRSFFPNQFADGSDDEDRKGASFQEGLEAEEMEREFRLGSGKGDRNRKDRSMRDVEESCRNTWKSKRVKG